jgi:ubiquinone/menaquinone biosynthesis C-methylase UbiE
MKKGLLRDWLLGEDTNVKEKDNWILSQLNSLQRGSKILDAGAGRLRWKKHCRHLQYVSQDFCQYHGKECETGLQNTKWEYPHIDIVSDIVDIPVEDETFDAVLCTEVLEHVPNPNRVLEELVRVTKPEGVLIITAPFCSLTHMAPYHYCTGFNRYWFEVNLLNAGAKIEKCDRNGSFYSWIRQEVIRLPFVLRKYQGRGGVKPGVKIRSALFAHSLKKYIELCDDSGELLCFEYMIQAKKLDRISEKDKKDI